MPDSAEIKRMTIRVAPELLTALDEWGEEEERSLHGQIVYLLRRAVAEHEAEKNMTAADRAEVAAWAASADRIARELWRQTFGSDPPASQRSGGDD